VTLEEKANVFIPLLRCDTASSDRILDVDICDVKSKILSESAAACGWEWRGLLKVMNCISDNEVTIKVSDSSVIELSYDNMATLKMLQGVGASGRIDVT
jgi:hypothetical protein